MSALHGYVAHDGDPDEFAILVFARSEEEARRLARPVIHGYIGGFLADAEWNVDVERAESADPVVWGVDAPVALEPEACWDCERWSAASPIGDDGFCDACREDHL